MGARAAQNHWLREAPLIAQPLLTMRGELFDRILRKELRADGSTGCFPRDGLGAIFAELGDVTIAISFRPGAAWAGEAAFLIHQGETLDRPTRPVPQRVK